VVAVAVPDKVCLPRAPWVVEVVVESPRNIADDPLHSLLVLRYRSPHEPTNVADGECQVRPCVGEVAKASHKTSVLCSVHLLCRAVAAQLQSLLHWSESWVAIGEPSQLNDALGVGSLSKRDPGVALVHLDPQVEGEKPQVPARYGAHCNKHAFVFVAMATQWVRCKKHRVEHNLFEIFEALGLSCV
jgi:hypothetical protein